MPKDINDSTQKALHEDHFKKPLKFQPDHIDIDIRMHEVDNVDVEATFYYKDQFPSEAAPDYIELDFEDLKLTPEERKKDNAVPLSLLSLELDGKPLKLGVDYQYIGGKNKIHLNKPKNKTSFTLTAKTNVSPKDNTTGVGLYMSDGNIFFKGETMNFRKVVPIQDRTDVLATFKVNLSQNPQAAGLKTYNQLLSNGTCTAEGTDADGYICKTYEDNTPKPCYLMGVQAGEFSSEEYSYAFSNGHKVKIFTHAPLKDKNKDKYVVEGIMRGMEYLDKEFGLIYDKPEYHITSLTVFNAGATETKSMPMFAAGYFTADKDYVLYSSLLNTMAVVIHEYIHEFVGNTFYINNWLELATKEGQTVFLEQLATAAMLAGPDVVRMTDMNGIINGQFAKEDDQKLPPVPRALNSERDHYSSTTYSKGAECFRMMHTLMGHDTYTKLVKAYVDQYAHQNASIDDFMKLAESHHNYDYSNKFIRWFKQSGRATVEATGQYKADTQEFVLSLSQSFKEDSNEPLPIPLGVALCIDGKMEQEQVFVLDQEQDNITFKNVTKEPEAYSINRGFTAPIEIKHDQDSAQALKLLNAETDGVTQLLIIQELHNKEILERYSALENGQAVAPLSSEVTQALQVLIKRSDIAPDVLAKLLSPSPCTGLRTLIDNVDPLKLNEARKSYLKDIAETLYQDMNTRYQSLRQDLSGPYKEDKALSAKRSLASCLLGFTTLTEKPAEAQKIIELYDNATNGHDRIHAASQLGLLRKLSPQDATRIENDFLNFMGNDTNGKLIAMKVLAAETTDTPDALLNTVLTDPKYGYDWSIPHHGKMVAANFVSNYANFHADDGKGYEALADMAIKASTINPEVAGSIAEFFKLIDSIDDQSAARMYKALKRMESHSAAMPEQIRKTVKDCITAYDEKNNGDQSLNSPKPSCDI